MGLGRLAALTAALAALCALPGVLYAVFAGAGLAAAAAWSLWVGGCLVVLVVGQSGSPTRMAGEARYTPGFVWLWGSDNPLPQSPFVLIPIGFVVIGIGTAVYALGPGF